MGVFFPAILKSWPSFPLLVTLNVTLPAGADDLESVNLSVSLAATVIVVAVLAGVAAGASSNEPSTTRAAAASERLVI